MNTSFTFEPETFDYRGGSGGQATEFGDPEAWEIGSTYAHEFDLEGGAPVAPPRALSGAALARAVAANRILARRFGWGRVIGGRVQPIQEILTLLSLAAGASEEDTARAIARWQETELHQRGDGVIGPGVWARILRRRPAVIPVVRFRRVHSDVVFGGRKLGILEKTAPYLASNDGSVGGASIQLGFRVTDMDAVRRAGFVNGGEDNFRWIQRLITNRQFVNGGLIRRHGRYVDPQSGLRDNHPYYWDEAGQGDPTLRNDAFTNRPARDANHPDSSALCYDLLFEDGARRGLTEAHPGRRVYWNAEVALVGVRPPKAGVARNVVLNTMLWGFDLVIESGMTGVRLNKLRPGVPGGSREFRQVLSEAKFPNHCFVGGGFSRAATCT